MKEIECKQLEDEELIDDEFDPNELFVNQEKEGLGELDFSKIELDLEPSPSNKELMPKSLSEIDKTLLTAKDFTELLKTVGMLRKKGYQVLFRGLPLESFQLQPSIVWNKVKDYVQEKEVLEQLKTLCKSLGYEKFRLPNFNENLFYMSIGRHLGLHSRLIDWTAGINEALAFLIEDKKDFMEHDGCLWLLFYNQNKYHPENKDPFLIDDNKLHILKEDYNLPDDEINFPLGIDRRFKQHGFFTTQAEDLLDTPFEELAKSSGFELYPFIVPKETKKLLALSDKLPSLVWLYGNQDDPIIDKVKGLNGMFKYKL